MSVIDRASTVEDHQIIDRQLDVMDVRWDSICSLSHRRPPIRAPWTRFGTGVGFSAREFSGETTMGQFFGELSHRVVLAAGKPLIWRSSPLPAGGTFPSTVCRLPAEPDISRRRQQKPIGQSVRLGQ